MSKKGDVYRKAAEIVQKGKELGGWYSCHAICDVKRKGSYDVVKERDDYQEIFKPEGSPYCSWLENDPYFEDVLIEYRHNELKEWRLTALCLAAAMADAGDL